MTIRLTPSDRLSAEMATGVDFIGFCMGYPNMVIKVIIEALYHKSGRPKAHFDFNLTIRESDCEMTFPFYITAAMVYDKQLFF